MCDMDVVPMPMLKLSEFVADFERNITHWDLTNASMGVNKTIIMPLLESIL